MTNIRDSISGLVNSITGLGDRRRDKGRAGRFYFERMSPAEIENAYRSDWVLRKAIDIPVADMLRQGWAWTGDSEHVEAITQAEQQFQVLPKVRQAVIGARLFGGAAIIIHDGAVDTAEPFDVRRMPRGGLRFLTPLDRGEIVSGYLEFDPLSDRHLQPQWYDVTSTGRGSHRLHPSRVVRFIGRPLPRRTTIDVDHWGDSYAETIIDAVRNATSVHQAMATLVQEASVDVFGIPDLMRLISEPEYRDALRDRLQMAAETKSNVHALIMDAGEEYTTKPQNFTQLPEVSRVFIQVAAGAADIPLTRFLGQSPGGLQSTGESDLRNYYDRLKGEQETALRPPLTEVLAPVVYHALGEWPKGLEFEFRPLWQETEAEAARTELDEARAVEIYAALNLIPGDVLAEGVKNRLIERGTFPGLEDAYAHVEAERQLETIMTMIADHALTPDQLQVLAGAVEAMQGADPGAAITGGGGGSGA